MRKYLFADGTEIAIDGYMDAMSIKENEQNHGKHVSVTKGNQTVKA